MEINKTIRMMLFCIGLFSPLYMNAQIVYTDAKQLTLVGKAEPSDQFFHRVDLQKYSGLSSTVQGLLKNTAGFAISFKTNSPLVAAKWTSGATANRAYVNPILEKGLDLYIRRGDNWEWAGGARSAGTSSSVTIVENMDNSEKECLLYLPVYEEILTLEIGVSTGSAIQALPSAWKGKVLIYGTSITQGASASRPGMAYPSRLCRETGINFINLGLSGNGTMETADADMLADLTADAYILDCVTNCTGQNIKDRTAYIVNTIRASHPDAPIIMIEGVNRESGSFDVTRNTYFKTLNSIFKAEYDKLITAGVTKLYYIRENGFLGTDHDGTTDGTHPNDLGFTRMIEVIKPQIMTILEGVIE